MASIWLPISRLPEARGTFVNSVSAPWLVACSLVPAGSGFTRRLPQLSLNERPGPSQSAADGVAQSSRALLS